jgi:hypothetical protein
MVWSEERRRLGLFLTAFTVLFTSLCLIAPSLFAADAHWSLTGALLLFFVLFTLVNAPIDWLALGFTRAFLRKGLSLGGWAPFAFALLDIVVACALIAVLAVLMVVAVQTFYDFSVLRGGPKARILPLGPLFESLETQPGAYENWWLWLLLFSSMIPSFANLCIASASFLRGLPVLNNWILARLPQGKALREDHRYGLASVLTAQVVIGAALAGAAFYLTLTWFVPVALPGFGDWLRELSLEVAAYNAPARIMRFWLASP